jgi:predicted DCC family thiol-disulfide oxidoreductase YuxK
LAISSDQLIGVRGVVFFDAKCLLCWRVQKQLTAWGNTHALKFVPLQQFEAWKAQFEVLQPVTEAEIRQGIRVFEVKANRLLIGVPAVAFCLKNCRFPYHWLGAMLDTPVFQPVLIPLYNWVAANRYRFLPALTETEEAKLYADFEEAERCSTTTTGACGHLDIK